MGSSLSAQAGKSPRPPETAGKAGTLSNNGGLPLQLLLHDMQGAAVLQAKDQNAGNDGSHSGGDEEGDDIDEQGGGRLSHEGNGQGIGGQTAQDPGSNHLADQREGQTMELPVTQTAQECTAHAAGKGQHGPHMEEIADERGDKRGGRSPPGTEQHGAQNVDHMLCGGAVAPKHRELNEHAAHNGNGDKHGRNSQLFGGILSHEKHAPDASDRSEDVSAPPGSGTTVKEVYQIERQVATAGLPEKQN